MMSCAAPAPERAFSPFWDEAAGALFAFGLLCAAEPDALPPEWVALAARTSVLYFDERVDLDRGDVEIIRAQVRSRIFNAGFNALDRQMPHAKSYQSPRDLYRFLTGKLYQSVDVKETARGVLELRIDYDNVILAVLEDMYGRIFAWSPKDVELVDAITRDKLRAAGVPKEFHTMGDAEREVRRAARARYEAEQQAAQKAAYLEALNRRVGDHIPPEKRDPERPQQTRYDSKAFLLDYDPRANLGAAELMAIRDKVKQRIDLQGLTAAGADIPRDLKQALNRDTFNSIEVRAERPGRLRMDVVYRNLDLPALEQRYGRVFGWGKNDVRFVDDLVRARILDDRNIAPTKPLPA